MLFTDRDETSPVYSNKKVKWNDWNNHLEDIVCRCAESAMKAGYQYFGIQFYGECWSGPFNQGNAGLATVKSDKCRGKDYKKCSDLAQYCVGEADTILIYKQQIDVDECADGPCKNGAKCIDGVNSYKCECAPGFNGKNCETNDCVKKPCQNGGECIDGVNSYKCECAPGYTGPNCETIPSECKNYKTLNRRDRAMNVYTSGVNRCDQWDISKGWYRFEGGAGTAIATKCPSLYSCGTFHPGWMKGTHPSQAEVVTRQACYVVSGNCCGRNNNIRVRNCGGFYVYELVKPPACRLRYMVELTTFLTDVDDCVKKPCQNGGECIDGVNSYKCECAPGYTGPNCETIPSECKNYKTLNRRDRAMNVYTSGVNRCDQWDISKGWYRFEGGAGTAIATKCPSLYSCGTFHPGWMKDITCSRKFERVSPGCLKANDVKSGEALLPKLLFTDRNPKSPVHSNKNVKWYDWNNYIEEVACRCAESAAKNGYQYFGIQSYGDCWGGTFKQGNAGLSSVISDKCLGKDYNNCSDFAEYCVGEEHAILIYKQQIDHSCSRKFKRVSPGCLISYDVNSGQFLLPKMLFTDRDETSIVYSNKTFTWNDWNNYLEDVACRCAESAAKNGYRYFGIQFFGECWSGPFNQGNASLATVKSDKCWGKDYKKCSDVAKYCAGEIFTIMIYKQQIDVDECANKPCQNGAECIDGANAYTCKCTAGYTGPNCETNMDDCFNEPCQNGGECIDGVNSYECKCKPGFKGKSCEIKCKNYKTLNARDRSMKVRADRAKCDNYLSKGWYRFEGEAGTAIATKCPPRRHCGAHAPGWMKGTHPSQAEGAVTRHVCYNWRGNCCRWTNSIRVRNCGGFYVYELNKPPACRLRYCGNGD
ncbi:Fibropellin-1 [Exaiptasia diaphana]|nr:Fibropellin-1 [Exaiptasia diaphana]